MSKNEYSLRKLECYVEAQIPKLRIVNAKDLETMVECFTREELTEFSGLETREIIDSFWLSLITESLTEQYSETFKKGAAHYGAMWLGSYIVRFWEPDEISHAYPFKKILLTLGMDESSIDKEIARAKQSTDYSSNHKSGLHPIELTTYGMIQECITDYWYGLQRGLLAENSNSFRVISKVKGREALHTLQFTNLTAIQLEAEPELIENVIQATLNFQMPANEIPTVKDIELKTQSWIPKMNGEVIDLLKKIVGNLYNALEDTDKIGKLFTMYASYSERRFIKLIPNRFVSYGIKNLRQGYGIVGEIVLEQLGFNVGKSKSPNSLSEEIEFRIKTVIKRWAKHRLYLEGFLEGRSAPSIQ